MVIVVLSVTDMAKFSGLLLIISLLTSATVSQKATARPSIWAVAAASVGNENEPPILGNQKMSRLICAQFLALIVPLLLWADVTTTAEGENLPNGQKIQIFCVLCTQCLPGMVFDKDRGRCVRKRRIL
ncbi:hypothetical protein CHUAL_010878 [Chamberlinius hualienensis]